MNHFSTQNLLAALALMTQVRAGIKADGLWTGNDYYKEDAKIGVENGVPYSKDAATRRRIEAAMTVDGDALDYMSKPNVQRVMRLVDQDDWEFLFPIRAELYDYDGFLHAVGKFEAFCGESNLDDYSLDETCARELAALFAHFGQETGLHDEDPSETGGVEEWRQGLYWVTEIRCTEGLGDLAGTSTCDYKQSGWADQAYPSQPDVQYYGRGPFQLSWNYNYGQFSKVLVPSAYDGTMHLLINPDLVATDAYTVFTSALWFYMTPQYPKPSSHDVMSGFMVPTDADLGAGIGATFGTTVNIINGGIECRQGQEKAQVLNRIKYYKAFLDWFDLPQEAEEGLGCANHGFWPQGGYGDSFAYFTDGWESVGGPHCTPVKWQTPYSVYTRDDYKRCVCDNSGEGAEDCQQADPADSDDNDDDDGGDIPIDDDEEDEEDDGDDIPIDDDDEESEEDDGDDTPIDEGDEEEEDEEDDQQDGGDNDQDEGEEGEDQDDQEQDEEDDQDDGAAPIDISNPEEEFNDIHNNPHYSDTEKSRTMYQVDRSLDYIELKMAEIQALFKAHNFIQ